MSKLYRFRTGRETVGVDVLREYQMLIRVVTGIDAPCIENAFVINIGDQFARWTSQ
jgi:isopenicillin N synthase-like dioxygenase